MWSRIRDEEPVFYSEAMGAWVVSRYHDARAVLTDPRRFSSEGTKAAIGVPPPAAQAILDEGDPIARARSLLDSDPPHHTEVRRIINEAFKGREVRKIEPGIRALANEIIDDIEPLESADFIRQLSRIWGSAGGRICASGQLWPASTWRSRCRYWQSGCRASALRQVPGSRSGPASRFACPLAISASSGGAGMTLGADKGHRRGYRAMRPR